MQSSEDKDAGLAAMLVVIFICLLIFFIPWIVCNLVFADKNDECLKQELDNISITLQTWLQVDAYCMIGLLGIVLLIAIVVCLDLKTLAKITGFCGIITFVLYSIFRFAWLIVGAVMFWGELDKDGTCGNSLTIYMYIVLIFGFVGIFTNCCLGKGVQSRS